jgi:hypothetical protein
MHKYAAHLLSTFLLFSSTGSWLLHGRSLPLLRALLWSFLPTSRDQHPSGGARIHALLIQQEIVEWFSHEHLDPPLRELARRLQLKYPLRAKPSRRDFGSHQDIHNVLSNTDIMSYPRRVQPLEELPCLRSQTQGDNSGHSLSFLHAETQSSWTWDVVRVRESTRLESFRV